MPCVTAGPDALSAREGRVCAGPATPQGPDHGLVQHLCGAVLCRKRMAGAMRGTCVSGRSFWKGKPVGLASGWKCLCPDALPLPGRWLGAVTRLAVVGTCSSDVMTCPSSDGGLHPPDTVMWGVAAHCSDPPHASCMHRLLHSTDGAAPPLPAAAAAAPQETRWSPSATASSPTSGST